MQPYTDDNNDTMIPQLYSQKDGLKEDFNSVSRIPCHTAVVSTGHRTLHFNSIMNSALQTNIP